MSIPAYIIVVIVCLFILLWSRYMIVDYRGDRFIVCSRGYLLLGIIASFVPLLNIFVLAIIVSIYIGARCTGEAYLKDNKFNNFMFKK